MPIKAICRSDPNIGSERWIGPTTLRRGIISSLNIVAARTLYEWVTPEVSRDYLINLGVDPSRINMDGPGLALGTSGFTPIEMAAAFGAIASGGEYKEPLSFTKVLDAENNVILDADDMRVKRQVFKKSTCYLLVDMMTDAVRSGTGTEAKINGMTVAGKTGTNSDYSSVYFAGMTPYYTASIWVGHDDYSPKLKSGSTGGRYAAPLWQAFMEKIHEVPADAPIINESPGDLGLVKRRVCSVSGLLATEACELDSAEHKPITDWFLEETAPTETCDMHVIVNVCEESGQQATTNCPPFQIVSGSVVLIRLDSPYMLFESTVLKDAIPNAVFTNIPIEEYSQDRYDPSGLCVKHSGGWLFPADPGGLNNIIMQAEALIGTVELYMANTPDLTSAERAVLTNAINDLEFALMGFNQQNIFASMSELTSVYNAIVLARQQNIVPSEPGQPGLEPTPAPEPTPTPDNGFGFGFG